MKRIYCDTETVGLHGPIVIIQYAIDDGPIIIHNVWKENVLDTMKLIEELMDGCFIGFNIAFELFHLNQTYNTLSLLDGYDYPDIQKYAIAEEKARLGVCLKPKSALDLMLHARKGPYQSTMEREDIRIKKIPSILAEKLCDELDNRIKFKDIYFARKADKKARWKVFDIKDDDGVVIPDFRDLVLTFAPSSALKALAGDALGYTDITVFSDVELPSSAMPVEYGYAPFATAVGKPGDWAGGWPNVISEHIIHWGYNTLARQYAEDDVKYTRELHYYFSMLACGHAENMARSIARGNTIVAPGNMTLLPGGDNDSILACMVGAIRWRGYEIDIPKIKVLKQIAEEKQEKSEYNFNSTGVCRKYLDPVLTPTEKLVMHSGDGISTKGIILEEIAKWKTAVVHDDCNGMGCPGCNNGFVNSDEMHPAAVRAKEILDYRHAGMEIQLYNKLLLAGRFHASFNVIGTLSGRMSGSDGLNPQGINRSLAVRECFPLAGSDMVLTGGDFSGFEICLMDAVYGDPELRKDILTKRPCVKCTKKGAISPNCGECKGTGQEGTKIHALFGQFLFPPMTYDQIYATKGLPGDQDKYGRSKNGVFALAYGGEGFTLTTRVGVPTEVADAAYQGWITKYKVWGQARAKIFDMFCSMRQPGGLGSKVEWADPADYIESMRGFRRYFTLENRICKTLFAIAEDPPTSWTKYKIKVMRRDREQTPAGALRSALFGAAFAIQAANMRAAANHVIQASGAEITKDLQCKIWELQPHGVAKWHVVPMNIHDEIMNPCLPEVVPNIQPIIDTYICELIKQVPLAGIEWGNDLKSWADK